MPPWPYLVTNCGVCGHEFSEPGVWEDHVCESDSPGPTGLVPMLRNTRLMDDELFRRFTEVRGGSATITREMLEAAFRKAAGEGRLAPLEREVPQKYFSPVERRRDERVLVWINTAECLGLVVPREVAEDAVALGYELAEDRHQEFFVRNKVEILHESRLP